LENLAARFHRTSTKSKASKANLEDVVSLYRSILGAEALLPALAAYRGVHCERISTSVVQPIQACINDFQGFKALVEQTVDLAQAEQRNYCINPCFDASLKQLAEHRARVKQEMETLRKSVDNALGISSKANEKVVSLADCPDGQAFRVVKRNQQAVQSAKGGAFKYKPLSFKKTEFLFTVPELEKMNVQLREVTSAYETHSEQLVEKATKVAATYAPVVQRLSESLSSLDVLAAFARASLTAPCSFVRPASDNGTGKFTIKGATHILVVANTDKSFVANDLCMGEDGTRLHLITGPNMGGKSTYIRSVALIALLNQIGCFVPCQHAVLPVFDSIMCRVGASDMQLRVISTFMAEMLEAACILTTATDRSS
jgi:DNA mismatch repair protein MSH2